MGNGREKEEIGGDHITGGEGGGRRGGRYTGGDK